MTPDVVCSYCRKSGRVRVGLKHFGFRRCTVISVKHAHCCFVVTANRKKQTHTDSVVLKTPTRFSSHHVNVHQTTMTAKQRLQEGREMTVEKQAEQWMLNKNLFADEVRDALNERGLIAIVDDMSKRCRTTTVRIDGSEVRVDISSRQLPGHSYTGDPNRLNVNVRPANWERLNFNVAMDEKKRPVYLLRIVECVVKQVLQEVTATAEEKRERKITEDNKALLAALELEKIPGYNKLVDKLWNGHGVRIDHYTADLFELNFSKKLDSYEVRKYITALCHLELGDHLGTREDF